MAGQADIGGQTRRPLSAAERLGSSAGQSTSGSAKIGTQQELPDGGASEQVTSSNITDAVWRQRLCTHNAQAPHDLTKTILSTLISPASARKNPACRQASCMPYRERLLAGSVQGRGGSTGTPSARRVYAGGWATQQSACR